MGFRGVRRQYYKYVPVLLAIFVVFWISLTFFHRYYIFSINSDAAFNQILASVIVESHQLFPKDVRFGNDIFLLRPQFVLALVRLCGIYGYNGYSIACALTITACFSILYVAIRAWPSHSIPISLLAAALILIPFGPEEYEYILGEQSHLQQTTFSIVGLLALARLVKAPSKCPLVVACLCSFLIAWDSSQRGMLFCAGMLAMLIPSFRTKHISPALIVYIVAAMLAGVGANRATTSLISRVGVSDYFVLASTREAVTRFLDQGLQLFSGFFGLDDVAQLVLSPASAAIVFAKLIVAMAFFWSVSHLAADYWRGCRDRRDVGPCSLINAAGLVMVAAGCIIVSISQFALDIRHYLPGLIILKAALILSLASRFRDVRFRRLVVGVVLAVAVLGNATASASFLAQNEGYFIGIAQRHDVTTAIKNLVQKNRWKTPIVLYGTFWNSSVYDFLLDGTSLAAPIEYENNDIRIYDWLSQPSRSCRKVPSILVVGADEGSLAAIAVAKGARKVASLTHHDIYLITPEMIANCRAPGM